MSAQRTIPLMRKRGNAIIVCILLTTLGCVPRLSAQATIGDQFRRVIANIDVMCRERKWGPYLDRSDPEYQRKVGITSCDILTLKPLDWRTAKMVKLESQAYSVPVQWLATPGAPFAHSIQLPPSVQLYADTALDTGGDEIFRNLCDKYAGEFKLRTVRDVTGLLQDRPFIPFPGEYRSLVFWTREKGDLGSKPQDLFVQPPLGEYEFLELRRLARDAEGYVYSSFERGSASTPKREINAQTPDGRFITVPYVVVDRPRSLSRAEYAYTWRGIWPGYAVEQGIEGYELIVYQVQPFEVLGVMRDFFRYSPDHDQRDERITTAVSCAKRKQMSFPPNFVRAVLRPKAR